MFSNQGREILEKKGLTVRSFGNRGQIMKFGALAGNILPYGGPKIVSVENGKEIHNQTEADSSIMNIFAEDGMFRAICWLWTPGPGPGDFDIMFNTEEEVISFILDYYFNPDNPYFVAISKYQIQNRDSISVNDVKAILDKFLQQLEDTFSDSEIAFAERGGYNKISPDDWRITSYQEERKMTETRWGFLNFEVTKLRKKVDEGTAFNFEDINNISSLMYELSLQIRDKN
jgi:hypothetical protein